MNAFTKLITNLNPRRLYNSNKHSAIAIVFVLLIILVSQYPSLFSGYVNTVFGKAIILIIIIILTNYNTLAGLAATIAVIIFYIYLFDIDYKRFVEGMENNAAENSIDASNKPKETKANGIPATLDAPADAPSGENVNDTKKPIQTSSQNPIDSKVDSSPNHIDLKFTAESATKSEDSNSLPTTMLKNANVAAAEPINPSKKSTNSVLKGTNAIPHQ